MPTMSDRKNSTTLPGQLTDFSGGSCCSHRARYLVLILGSLCLSSICSNMITFNFTMICMDSGHERHIDNLTGSGRPGHQVQAVQQFSYNQQEKSILLWAVAIGALIGTVPFNWLYDYYGARYVFFGAGILSSGATAMVPYMASLGLYYFVLVRVVQGITFAGDFATIGLMTAQWASLKQHGLFISMLTGFSQISVIFTMPVSGQLCTSAWGWPSVYYVHAVVCLLLFTVWVIYYRDDPKYHRSVSAIELEKIQRHKSEEHNRHDRSNRIPYVAIFTNVVIWSVWIAAFADLLAMQLVVIYGPTYLNEVLGFSVEETGSYSALPLIAQFVCKLVSGYTSDKIKFISESNKLKLYNTVALAIAAVFFSGLGFIPVSMPWFAVFVLILAECAIGFNSGGFNKCGTLVARQYGHFVMGQIQFIKCLSLFIEPLMVSLLVLHNDLSEWRLVFLLHAAILILANVVFCIYATDQPAAFTMQISSGGKIAPNGEQKSTIDQILVQISEKK